MSGSRQVAVRLPEQLVEYMDELVAQGDASSRAAVVTRAVDEMWRRQRAERDAAILAAAAACAETNDDDLDRLAEYTARVPMNDID